MTGSDIGLHDVMGEDRRLAGGIPGLVIALDGGEFEAVRVLAEQRRDWAAAG